MNNTNKDYSIEMWPREHVDGGAGSPVISLLMSRNIAMIACGSLACVKSVYEACRNCNSLDRFIPFIISDKEYALGRNEAIVVDCINKVLKQKKVDGIVVYVSCCEVMMGTDFASLEQKLDNPDKIPVIPFFRGPLCRRRIDMRAVARRIAERFPPAKTCCGYIALPVPSPDFSGVNLLAAEWGYERVLLTAGGCASSMTPTDISDCLVKTRFNDIIACHGKWDGVLSAVGENIDKTKPCVIMKTATPSIVMNGTENFSLITGEEQIHLSSTNGWKSASRGISEFLLSELKRSIKEKNLKLKDNTHCIMGYSVLSCGSRDEFEAALAENDMQNAVFWTPYLDYIPSAVTVVSYEALAAAQYLKKKYGTEYCCKHPLGADFVAEFISKVKEYSKNGDTICISGDPYKTCALETLITNSIPDALVKKIIYMPVSEEYTGMKRIFENDFAVCRDAEELAESARGCSLFIGDNCYKGFLSSAGVHCKFIDIPYGIIN